MIVKHFQYLSIKIAKMKVSWTPHKKLIINTKRFFLRSLILKDATPLQQSWLNDKDTNKWLNSYYKKHSIKSIKSHIKSYDNYNNFHLGVFVNTSSAHIGNFSILVDHFHKIAEIRVLIGNKNWWGKDVVIECRREIINWLFLDLKMFKIFGSPVIDNVPAIFNYQKQGFTCECILKKHKLKKKKKVCEF